MSEVGLRVITSEEVLRPSHRFPVTLQGEGLPPLGGYEFSSDEDAVKFKASERPEMFDKIEVPLELPMHAAFRLTNPDTTDRPGDDFRMVLADREVAPAQDESCTVMPYVLFNGIVSVVLRIVEPQDEDLFMPDSFWLNVFEPGVSQPFSGVTDNMLQFMMLGSELPADEVFERYMSLKQQAGRIIQRVVNAPVPAPSI